MNAKCLLRMGQSFKLRLSLAIACVVTSAVASAGELTIYSSVEGDNLKNFASLL